MLDTTATRPVYRVPAAELAEGLKFLARALGDKSPAPILHNVLFPGDGTMVATNLDQRAIWRFSEDAYQVGHQMPFTVPHKSLLKVIKGADKGKLIALTGHAEDGSIASVEAQADGLKSTLKTLPAEDFPVDDQLGDAVQLFTMPASDLRDALRFVAPCISTEETRYYLNGVYMHPAAGELALVATDGHKLGFRAMPGHSWLGERDSDQAVILPTEAVKALLATFPAKPKGAVSLVIHKRGAVVACDQWTLESKAIDGSFPDYTRVCPTNQPEKAQMPVAETLKAVKRLHGLSSKDKAMLAVCTVDGLLTYRDEDRDTHKMALTAQVLGGDGVTFGVNINYLKAALETFSDTGATALRHETASARDPMRFTGDNPDREFWIVMPMDLAKGGY